MSRPNATEAGLNYYRSQLRGANDADEGELTDDERKLRVPVLVIGGRFDTLAPAEIHIDSTKLWAVAEFESVILDGGHWLSIERASEVTSA